MDGVVCRVHWCLMPRTGLCQKLSPSLPANQPVEMSIS